MDPKKTVVIGLIGSLVDAGTGPNRWQRWRPTVSLFQHPELPIDRLELLSQKKYEKLTAGISQDIQSISPQTVVATHPVEFKNPWDFEEVYGALLDFARKYPFVPDKEEYLIHITTGTHVAQICMFLLTEAHYFPAKLIQTAPPTSSRQSEHGAFTIIDLDLSRYDTLASRFTQEKTESLSFLKSGIDTRNAPFNRLIEQIEKVAIHSKSPLLLMGPTGAGKSQLARKLYELKKARRQVSGNFVDINCATIRGDAAMSALFGHTKGAFTGAVASRPGLLRTADGGLLFLDEVGELGLDEQAMLLRALEEKRFLPVGADTEVRSDFQLLAGTNRDLTQDVAQGRFREDLFARINLWTFRLPALKDRREDIEPNLDYELAEFARVNANNVTFNKEARERYLAFARTAPWPRNFRDLNASVNRMATLAPGARITRETVEEEIAHLQQSWNTSAARKDELLPALLTEKQLAELDRFDRVQLEDVVKVCRQARSLSDAGRSLFAASRQKRKMANDADRLRKYLARFDLAWDQLV